MTDLLKEQALGFEEAFEKLQVGHPAPYSLKAYRDMLEHFSNSELEAPGAPCTL